MAKINNEKYKMIVESRLTSLEVKVSEVIENHIPHLDDKIDKLIWLTISSLGGLVGILITLLYRR